eukprot:6775785-Ditylum_brightwellii.AAC.1
MVGNMKHHWCSWCAAYKADHGIDLNYKKCPNYDPNSCNSREYVTAAEVACHLQHSEESQASNINSNQTVPTGSIAAAPTGSIADGVDLGHTTGEDTVNGAEKDPPHLWWRLGGQ